MKKLNDDLFVVEPAEMITIRLEAINTPNLSAVSLDGTQLSFDGDQVEFQASPQKGTSHFLAFAFTFAGADKTSGSYQVNLSGSAGGSSKFTVKLSSDNPVSTLVRRFRVGSAEEGKLGIDPPSPWPHG